MHTTKFMSSSPTPVADELRNVILDVERFGRKLLCSPGRIPARSQHSLRPGVMAFSSILADCATSGIPLYLSHSSQSFFLWNTMMMASFHFCPPPGRPPPNTNNGDIEQPSAQGGTTGAGNVGDLNLNSVLSTASPFTNEQMAPISSCIVGRAPSDTLSGHWSRPSTMFGSTFGYLTMRRV